MYGEEVHLWCVPEAMGSDAERSVLRIDWRPVCRLALAYQLMQNAELWTNRQSY